MKLRKLMWLALIVCFVFPTNTKVSAKFADVPPIHSSYEDVKYMFEKGILDFGDTDIVTRAEVIGYIARSVGLDGTPKNTRFKDVSIKNKYSGYIHSAFEAGIVNGFSDDTFRPNEEVTRGHAAVFIARAFDLPHGQHVVIKDVSEGDLEYTAVQQLYALDITKGYGDGTFRPNNSLTRAHLITFLARTLQYLEKIADPLLTVETLRPITAFDESQYNGQARITFSYDDGFISNYLNSVPLHVKYDIPATFNIIAGNVYSGNERYMDSKQVWVTHNLGFEIASHTLSHRSLTELSDEEIHEEFIESKFILEDLVGKISTLTVPNSLYDERVRNIATEYFDGVRVFSRQLITEENYDPYWMTSYVTLNTTSFSNIKDWIDRAVADKAWLIIMLHGVTDTAEGEYEITPYLLDQVLQYVDQLGKEKLLPVSTSDGITLMNR